VAITITEALADLKTLGKRIEKKREYIASFLVRQDGVKDPLAKEGGSEVVIARERQAITDLETRHVAIRTAIQRVNQAASITVTDVTKTIAEWLTWRKEVAPGQQAFVNKLRHGIQQARTQAQQKGWAVVSATQTAAQPTDLVVNADEAALAAEAERLETILGTLDGQLSLKNATVTIDV
jgi:microcystin degradation protein MlrC